MQSDAKGAAAKSQPPKTHLAAAVRFHFVPITVQLFTCQGSCAGKSLLFLCNRLVFSTCTRAVEFTRGQEGKEMIPLRLHFW